MMIDGKWVDNITCRRCRRRHPAEITCERASRIAQGIGAPVPELPYGGIYQAGPDRWAHVGTVTSLTIGFRSSPGVKPGRMPKIPYESGT